MKKPVKPMKPGKKMDMGMMSEGKVMKPADKMAMMREKMMAMKKKGKKK